MATILCIDDDAQFCRTIAEALREAGYDAVAARTAGEGLQQIERADLAIVDLGLRGVGGDEVVRAIRAVRPIPVILTSGSDAREIARACGARHFLPKPFDLDELLTCAETLLLEARRAAS